MLKGMNELRLNEATMMAILEEYFNRRITSSVDEVVVTGVDYLSGNYAGQVFRVTLKPAQETA